MSKMPKQLGKYQLLSLIRTSSVHEMWRAVHIDSQRAFLIKALARHQNERQLVRRLRHEALVSQQIFHTGVQKVFAFETAESVPHNVIEYFPGQTLRSYMTEKHRAEVLSNLPGVISEIVAAIRALHEAGWIHTGISPAHFLLNQRFSVRLIDLTQAQKHSSVCSLSFLGRKCRMAGNFLYASPEQLQGQAIDLRSDIYSLGCVIFELVEGQPPYTGANLLELKERHLNSKVPKLTRLPMQFNTQFSDLVFSMMAKAPELRPASILHVQHAFASCIRIEDFTKSDSASGHLVGLEERRVNCSSAAADVPAIKTRPMEAASLSQVRVLQRSKIDLRFTRLVLNRTIQISVLLVAAIILSSIGLYTESDGAERKILQRTIGIVGTIRTLPKLNSKQETRALWEQVQSEAESNWKETERMLLPATSSRPDRLELSWAAGKVRQSTFELSRNFIPVSELAVVEEHLQNAEKHLKRRMDLRNQQWNRCRNLFNHNYVVFGLLVINILGVGLFIRSFQKQ